MPGTFIFTAVIGANEVMVQGIVLSTEGTHMSRDRISAVLTMPFSRSAHEMKRYLGLVNFTISRGIMS